MTRLGAGKAGPSRSRTNNFAECPLGWLYARRHVTTRQFEADERLRCDWERAQFDPCVTMLGRGARGVAIDPPTSQIEARRCFASAVDSAGPGLADIVGGSSAPAKVCARLKPRVAGRRARENWCLAALDWIAGFYRIA